MVKPSPDHKAGYFLAGGGKLGGVVGWLAILDGWI